MCHRFAFAAGSNGLGSITVYARNCFSIPSGRTSQNGDGVAYFAFPVAQTTRERIHPVKLLDLVCG